MDIEAIFLSLLLNLLINIRLTTQVITIYHLGYHLSSRGITCHLDRLHEAITLSNQALPTFSPRCCPPTCPIAGDRRWRRRFARSPVRWASPWHPSRPTRVASPPDWSRYRRVRSASHRGGGTTFAAMSAAVSPWYSQWRRAADGTLCLPHGTRCGSC